MAGLMIGKKAAACLSAAVAAVALSAAPPGGAPGAPRILAVKGGRVNLRAAPHPEGEPVAQVSTPDTLVLKGAHTNAWVEVAPPDSVSLWVFADLVKDGKVAPSAVQIRTGASLNHASVGLLPHGAAVTARGRSGEWLEIAPPPEASLYITNAYVELLAPAPPKQRKPYRPPPAKKKSAAAKNAQYAVRSAVSAKSADGAAARVAGSTPRHAPQDGNEAARDAGMKIDGKPEAESVGGAAPDEIEDAQVGAARVPRERLRQDIAQAVTRAAFTGRLEPSPGAAQPTKFRLVADEDGAARMVCHVLGNTAQLESLKGGRYTIEGVIYWFRGTPSPTVFAQDILRHPAK